MKIPAHITVGGEPFCGWLGCAAGQDKAEVAARTLGVHPVAISCGHETTGGARKVAKALAPLFRKGAVAVVAGPCPDGAKA
jgi:hypothetical protein